MPCERLLHLLHRRSQPTIAVTVTIGLTVARTHIHALVLETELAQPSIHQLRVARIVLWREECVLLSKKVNSGTSPLKTLQI